MYWLLSYADAIERETPEWTHMVLINPRHCTRLTISFDQLVRMLAAGRSKVEILELFSAIIGERKTHKHT